LDDALRERLHLKSNSQVTLNLVRAAMHSSDAICRVLSGHPFFGLKETETILTDLPGLTGERLIRAVLARDGGTEIVAHGLDNIPETGPVIIAATHPTGLFDFVAHAAVLLERRPDLKVVANRETERFLGPDIIIPVQFDKHNMATSPVKARRAMFRHVDEGNAMMVFGSGRVPDRRNGRLVEPKWRRGLAMVANAVKAPIIPAALDARNSDAYYRTRAVARALSGGNDNFGAMIGSLRYMTEMMMKLGSRHHVYYGEPLASSTKPQQVKDAAEGLVPGLYASPDPNNSP